MWLRLIIFVIAGCEVYNLGTGKGTSVLEMVTAFEKASRKVVLKVDACILNFPTLNL